MAFDFDRPRSIWERLYDDRIIFLGTAIDDAVANTVVAHLLYMESQDPEKDIFLYVNSPGGSVTAGMAIYDTMQFIRAPVSTICIGQAASMAAVLLAAGNPGKRRILPNARVMIHQPLGGARGQASDIEITAKEILRWKKVLNEIVAHHTGQDFDKVKADSDRDYFLGAQEAKEYGLVDEVLSKEPVPDDS